MKLFLLARSSHTRNDKTSFILNKNQIDNFQRVFMKILSYFLSSIFAIVYFFFLLLFHPIQWIGNTLFGYKGHKIAVDAMNYVLMQTLLVVGIRTQLQNPYTLPEDCTLIFVANHQSLFDISPISWYFRKHHPKFVSKIELAKGIPSVSYNLQHGGAALINRKDRKQAITTLVDFAKRIHKNKWSAVIFPEGTRSRNGKPKKFSTNGLKAITKYNPEAYIVPLTINNSWKVFKYGTFPVGLFSPISITTHQPIQVNSMPFDALMEVVEQTIKKDIQ